MTFTKDIPTKPGAYWWRANPKQTDADLCLIKAVKKKLVLFMAGVALEMTTKELGGEWCELVPRDEVVPKGELQRVIDHLNDFASSTWHFDTGDVIDRAKRVMDGKE